VSRPATDGGPDVVEAGPAADVPPSADGEVAAGKVPAGAPAIAANAC
jgi:hypothetical protein